MKVVVIMFGMKKSKIRSSKDTRKVLYRPDYMVYAIYNPQTRRYGKRKLVRIKHSTLPDDVTNKILVNNTAIVVWNNDDLATLKALLKETEVAQGKIKSIIIQNSLQANEISYKSLSSVSTDLGLKKCPRDGVTSSYKLLLRFVALKRIIKTILKLAKCEFFSEIIA